MHLGGLKIYRFLLLATILSWAGSFQMVLAQQGEAPPPMWQLTPEQIKQQATHVQAGEDLTPDSWPEGAKVAVSLSFDFDTQAVWMGSQGTISPSYMSRGEYGARVGLPRIIALLDKHNIPASFFIPAMTMVLHPDAITNIKAKKRHEIGFHSYVHENPMKLTAAEEREVYKKALSIFVQHVGKPPAGFRSAAWDLTPSTIEIVREMGFLYESSMMADDRPYRLLENGQDTGLVEIPVEWILDDWPLFQLKWPNLIGIRSTEEVYSIWKAEFDGAYEEGTLFSLTMHPQVIGHRYRMQMMDKLITYIKSKKHVWFATHEEIARYVLKQAAR